MKKFELRQIIKEEIKKVVSENKITIDDKDGEFIYTILLLNYNDMKRYIKYSKYTNKEEKNQQLLNLMKKFSAAYGDGEPFSDTSSPVDAMSSDLDRR
jgi:hypothetical protein